METLTNILYIVSTALLIPVIVALLGFLAWALVEFGGLVREMIDRWKGRSLWISVRADLIDQASAGGGVETDRFFAASRLQGYLGRFAVQGRPLRHNQLLLDKLAADIDIDVTARQSRMTTGTRIGPMLGLMGTLIPLGPALIELASGSIQEMARNLVVAFTTTVLGLAVGAVFFLIGSTRRKWYAQDQSDIDFVIDCTSQAKEDRDANPNEVPQETLQGECFAGRG